MKYISGANNQYVEALQIKMQKETNKWILNLLLFHIDDKAPQIPDPNNLPNLVLHWGKTKTIVHYSELFP